MKPELEREIEHLIENKIILAHAQILAKLDFLNDKSDLIHEQLMEIKELRRDVTKLDVFTGYIKGGLIVLTSLMGYGMIKLAPVLFGG